MSAPLDYGSGAFLLQVELSTVCNALCLGCVRIDQGDYSSLRSTIPKGKFLDINVVLGIFDTEAGRRLQRIEFCGNIDEPLAHPEFMTLLQKLYEKRPDLRVSIHTNGGLGKPELYGEMSQLLKRFAQGSNFRFSLDGLSDTNHIYRQNVKWEKAEANLRAAIAGGAPVIWQFLVFPWNEHQAEEARALAESWGCWEFWLRPDRSRASLHGLDEIRARQSRGRQSRSTSGTLSDLRDYARLVGQPIRCSFKEAGMLFLSWEGKVWPCCFISNILYETDIKKRALEKHMTGRYPENFNNLYHRNFDEVLESPLFKRDLVSSWKNGGRDDKMAFRCVERCSMRKKRSSDNKPDDRSFYAQKVFKAVFP